MVYSGFGQQLGPIVSYGAAGVIDGMAAFYPRTVTRLYELVERSRETSGGGDDFPELRPEIGRLQFIVSRAEEFVVRYGLIGIKEAVWRITKIGVRGSARLPVRGSMSDEEWEKGKGLFLKGIAEEEAWLANEIKL